MSYDESHRLYQEARSLVAEGEIEKAIPLFRESNKLYAHFKTLELWGECEMKLGNFKQAIIPLTTATELNSGPKSKSLLALAYNNIGEQAMAIELARDVISVAPNNKIAKGIISSSDKKLLGLKGMNRESLSIKGKISELLPNREAVRFFIWDELEGPLAEELDDFVKSQIEEYGSWKETYRPDGNLAYKGWIYRKRKQGHWIYYYKNGELHKDCYYRNNEFHGVCKIQEVDGSYEVNEYYKGRLNGYRMRYDAKGILYQKWLYEMGHSKEFWGPVELGLYKGT